MFVFAALALALCYLNAAPTLAQSSSKLWMDPVQFGWSGLPKVGSSLSARYQHWGSVDETSSVAAGGALFYYVYGGGMCCACLCILLVDFNS